MGKVKSHYWDEIMAKQEGGDHYKTRAIQPVEYIQANDLGFCEGSVIKYITRHKDKGGIEDVKKAIHFCEFILATYEKEKSLCKGDACIEEGTDDTVEEGLQSEEVEDDGYVTVYPPVTREPACAYFSYEVPEV